MIDLQSVRSLHAVDLHGSVVSAADALGFTPSAVSQQVKRLERQAGVPLLERVGRGVVLTAEGRSLVDAGSRVLADLESIEAGLHASAGSVTGNLRVAAFSTAMRGLVAPAAATTAQAHHDLDLRLQESEPWDAVELVATGEVDVAIVHSWGDVPLDVPDHLDSRVLCTDLADVLLHRDHRLAGRRTLTPRALVDETWVATPEGTICRQWLHRMYDGTGHRPRVVHEFMEFASHIALVEAGLGIALVPRLGRPALPESVVAVPVRDPEPTREIRALWRRSMAASPAVHAVVDALSSVARGRPGGVRKAPTSR